MPVTNPRAPRPGALLRRFRAARGGNVATFFALASVPLVAFSGAAIDYGMATRQQGKLQAAADATTLALCQTPNTTTADAINTQAQTMMKGYMLKGGVSDPSLVVNYPTIVPSTQTTARTIRLVANINSGTYFGNFTGVTTPVVGASSQCATPIPATFEIALVLDNTGSMAESSGNQTKIQALQQAANNFIEYVNSTQVFSDQTRISVVPFAGAVDVSDPNAPLTSATAPWIDWAGKSTKYHWNNVNKAQANTAGLNSRNDIFLALDKLNPVKPNGYPYYGWNWGGCVETPAYPANVSDVAPDPTQPDTLFQQYFAPDEPGSGNSSLINYKDTTNNATNGVWNDYIADSGTGCTTPAAYMASESSGCKYKVATKANSRTTTMVTSQIDLGQNGPNWGCASVPMQRLLTVRQNGNKATLEGVVNKMTARGSTNIHEGFMWGWRSLSPLSVFANDPAATKPSAYNTPSTPPNAAVNKVIVLMTDGMDDWLNLTYANGNSVNQNSAQTGNGGLYNALGYPTNPVGGDAADSSANPRLQPAHANPQVGTSSNVWDPSPQSGRSAIDGLLATACTNAKASPANISVYTIAFSISSDPIDQTGQNLLQNCASSTSQYFLANNSSQLITAFSQIAKNIGALRLSQ